jgi:phage baseplate assembly protein W
MASTVDLQALLETASGERIGRQSDGSAVTHLLIDRVFTKTLSEPDVMEAAAARQLLMREAPIGKSE